MINYETDRSLKICNLLTEISISVFSEIASTVQLKISVVVNFYPQSYCNKFGLKSHINDTVSYKLTIFIHGSAIGTNSYLALFLQIPVTQDR